MLFASHNVNRAPGLKRFAKNWKGKIKILRIPAGLIRKSVLGKNSAKTSTIPVEINVTISKVETELIPTNRPGSQ